MTRKQIGWLVSGLVLVGAVALAGGGMSGGGGPNFAAFTQNIIPLAADTYSLGATNGNKVWHEVATRAVVGDSNIAITPAANSTVNISNGLKILSTTGGGTITLSGGTGTATVVTGHRCVCTDTTANVSVKCAVSGTTLTATGTTTDVIAYFCF